MFNCLLYVGFVATAFAWYGVQDVRETKMIAAILFALGLIMTELYLNGIKPNKNVWVLLLLLYIPIAQLLAPIIPTYLFGIETQNFWFWKPFVKMLIFGLLFIVISSHEFSRSELINVLHIMVWCGFLTAVYHILQYVHLDQFFIVSDNRDLGRVAGFIGNPTLTAPFVAMLIPIAFYLRKYWMAGIMLIGAILPNSQMAWVALAGGIAVYFGLKNRRWMERVILVSIIAVLSFSALYFTNVKTRNLFSDHERTMQWTQIFKDWSGPLDPANGINTNNFLTGRGLGSFRYIYHQQHPDLVTPTGAVPRNSFAQAHNDYIELGYGLGFVSLCLLFMGTLYTLLRNTTNSFYNRALISSFAIIAISAIGSFVFQIGTVAYYSIIILGLIQNESRLA